MKTTCALLVSVAAIAVACSAAMQDSRPESERFAGTIRNWYNGKLQVTDDEIKALEGSHRVLRAIADKGQAHIYFWQAVRQEAPMRIAWDEAVELVRKGKIASASQSHFRSVVLLARDGRQYTTIEPEFDDILNVVREVDPTLVFVQYATE